MKFRFWCFLLMFWSLALCAQSATVMPPLAALRSVAPHSSLLSDDAFLPELQRDALQGRDPERRDCTKKEALKRWKEWATSATSIELLLCKSDHSIVVNIYPARRGGYLAILETVDGAHHQAKEFEYFWLDGSMKFKSEEKSKEKLGLSTAHWNDFVDGQKFKASENYEALMSIDQSGVIRMEPWTWMEPAWESRQPSNEIYYTWNGERFLQHVVPAK